MEEAISLAKQAVNQGTVLAEITSRVTQNDQIQQTLETLGSTPVQAADQAAAQPVVGAEPEAIANPVGSPDAPAGQGQSQLSESLTYATPELAQQAAEQQGVVGQVEISDTGNGYVLTPKPQPKTVRQLREQYTAVSELQDAIERTGAAGREIAVRSSFSVPLQTEGSGRSNAGADVGRTLELVSSVVEKAFGRAPIPVSGLGEFGVAYNGNLFIDVEQASSGDKAGNSGVALAIATIGHESTHALLQQSRDAADQAAYKNFRAVVLQYAKDGVVEKRQAAETRMAGGPDRAGIYGTRAYAESEVVADVSGAMWLDNKFWQRLYEVDNGSTMRRVLYKFMQAATRFIEVAKGSRLDAGVFVTNIDAVREAAAQAWAQRAGKQNPPAEIADLPAFSRGVSAEVAPDPRNTDMVQRWAALDTPAKERVTRQVMDEVAPKVFADLGLGGWSVEYTTGPFEGQVNPSAVIRAPEGTSAEQLGEVMRVFGYVLDQKGMVAFDENNTTSDSQAGFVKVILPEGLSAARIDAIRQTVSSAVPQAEGDTLRDGSLVFGNFSEYNDNVETLSDEAFKQAIVDALVASNPAENIDVAGPFRFHSEYDQAYWDDQYKPEGRNQYLERTRYASDQSQAESGRDSLRGRGGRADARSRIEAIAAETDQRVRELIERQADAGAAAGAQQGAADRRQEDRGGADAGQPVRSPGSSTGGVSGVDAAAGLPRYGKPISGAVSAIGYHFSKQQRSSLNSSYYGTGLRGAESERLSGPQNSDIRPRVFFYVDKGNGVRPEAGVGNVAHGVRLDNLYDIMGDPLGIIRAVRGMPGDASNNQERAVLQAGFDGYIKRDPVMPQDFIVLLGKQHGDVPVAPANPRRADGKTNSRQEPARTQERTRQEGDELVRRPQGMELNQIVKVRDEIKFAAPSFRLQYGEARVLASEAAMADQILADAGSTFQFGGPQFSMSDDFDERGAFNLDVNDEQLEWSPDFADGIEVAEKKDIDFDALQAELDQEFGRLKQRPARQSIDEPTDQQIKDAGLHAEDAIAFGPHKTTVSNIMLDAPKFLGVEAYVNYEIRRFDDRFAPTTDLDGIATFISGGKRLTEKAAVQFTQNQLAAEYLHKRGFDLADTYRKSTVLKIAEGWKALAKKAGAFKYPGSNIKSTSFKEIAAAMGLFKEYRVDVEYDEEVIFTDRKSGKALSATIIERADEIGCCTLGLAGSQLGVPFYTVAGKMAENIGKKFVADTSLSAINTYRRTEQALSYALKSGDTGVMLPGPQNRVYGYNEKPKTQQDHDWNIARLALANMRNVEELIPDVRRWSYDPATGQFVDSKGASAEEAVNAALADADVRALGIGRTTIARAVLTSQIIKGDFKAGNVEAFESPVLYSRTMVEEDPQPLSETWGQLNADGTYELAPKFANWFGDSKVVDAEGKPLVVYHGTNKDLSSFDRGGPIFVTPKPQFASKFAAGNQFASGRTKKFRDGANIMPVYVKSENPFDFEDANQLRAVQAEVQRLADKYGMGRMPIVAENIEGVAEGRWTSIEYALTDEAIKNLGHDGFYVMEQGVKNLAVFRPEQIKSAIGNKGDFDAGNPDIRFSRKEIESYMAQRNRGMRQVSLGSEQANDISVALAAMKELSAQMRPVHEKLSKQMSGEALQKAVMSQFRDFVLPVGRTPHVLTMLGAPNSMMKIDPSIVYKVFVDKHANDLEGAKAEDIIKAIYQPAMVLRGTNKNEVELVLPIVTSTGPLIVPVLSDSVMPTNNGRVSAIMSIYPRKVSLGGNSVLQRIKDGKLAYADAALAQVALTGNVSPQAGITAREVSLSSGTPPARTSQANVADAANLVKPANPYYVGWDKARDDIIGGIASKKVKSDVDLVRWIGNNFRGEWADAPSFSRSRSSVWPGDELVPPSLASTPRFPVTALW